MEGFLLLCALSLAMFVGSYFCGSVPLAVNFSESKLRMVTVFGAGLLVGTALAVIIPEGVQSIYEAQGDLHQSSPSRHEAEQILVAAKVAPGQSGGEMPPPDKQIPDSNLPGENGEPKEPTAKSDKGGGENIKRRKRHVVEKNNEQREKREEKHTEHKEESPSHAAHSDHDHPPHHHHPDHHSYVNIDVHSVIGLALVIGFLFMLCVDQVSKTSFNFNDVESSGVQPRYKMTATIGLVVHAAADGIALGAASTTKHSEIQFIVFVAIMLHKAPAAFGLVAFLLHEGLDKSRVRKHLLVFALAAPVLAVITYVGITQGGSATLSSVSTTGVLMLFSAGTFLYVSTVHVLPEIISHNDQYKLVDVQDNKMGAHSHMNSSPAFSFNELCALVVGALLPTLLNLGHSH